MATNDITGDELRSKVPSESYLNNFDHCFKGTYEVTYYDAQGNLCTDVVSSTDSVSARRAANTLFSCSSIVNIVRL